VDVVAILERSWFEGPAGEHCFRIKIKAEVPIPAERPTPASPAPEVQASAVAPPLTVRVWTERPAYRPGEAVTLALKGNKDFYARVVYRDAEGNLLQLLPNPYRSENRFGGGRMHRLPAAADRFVLEVAPPYGRETVTVYASTAPLGALDVTPAGPVFAVAEGGEAVGRRARSVDLGSGPGAVAEFVEASADVVVERP
jgi:hypothetical protein